MRDISVEIAVGADATLSTVNLHTQFIHCIDGTMCVQFNSGTMEQFAIQGHCVRDTWHLQTPAEDTSFRCLTYPTELH